MYAIFETGGKQYKVVAGDVLRIEKVKGAAGDGIKFPNVIAFAGDDGNLKTGTPYLDATVNATILGDGRGKKVIIFKFKAKKDYRKKQGHRQPFTEIEIENFTIDGKTVGSKPEKPAEDVKAKPESVKEEEPAKEETPVKAAKAQKKPEASADDVKSDDAKAEEAPSGDAKAEEAPADEVKTAKAKKKPEAPADDVKSDDAKVEETPADEVKSGDAKAEKAPETEAADIPASKLTKADIMAKLDELGADYAKSAKKDELLAILAEAESK